MKLLLGLSIALSSLVTSAQNILENCYTGINAPYFVSELEDAAQEGETVVSLLDEFGQVVGFISVSPKRAEKYPHNASEVAVHKLSLCTSELQVETFYYTYDADADLLNWTSQENVWFSQDEGMIVLKPQALDRRLVQVDFRGYDVFLEEEDLEKMDKTHPDYIEDWGLPRGKGTFFFYMPRNWEK